MTTLLFDPIERALYSDSLATSNGRVFSSKQKKLKTINIPNIGLCIYGASGGSNDILRMIKVLKSGYGAVSEGDQCSGLLIDKKGNIYILSPTAFEPKLLDDQKNCYADGSGNEFILSAYNATKDPILSMSVTKELDIYSGGDTVKAYFHNGIPVFERIKE